ncbi:phosphatidate cytidylyltransferase [Microlunatus phosphovorus NM-1]|uniref:Phosphatidate cytidylyltransferase n=1 Tax=Microlunatus phosphovorus (strain ATCC 700054 / DSM 10555 / JCM 9379 / NBRC 101784 / NCIMB 13414 / VKM Ac-1990 / NM-1) TaxID=1032480 RepID=F5XQL9_MICPN|nr:phosphatidate cytidylyltransferase [Microlunatus phosphovorus]BAK34519.1 phosphatidate cytidylyltransferase [Microlunatus phosphovorus NM-1]
MSASDNPSPAPPAGQGHGRAGRNLPAAIGLGVVLGAYVVLSLIFFKPAFVLLVAVALSMGSLELYHALKRHGMNAAIQPIIVGTLAISIGSYLAGRQQPVVFSTTSVLLAALALTVLAALIWRIPGGSKGYVNDAAASLFVIAYVPMLGSFAALMLAGEHGVARMVTYMLVVVMGDTGGYVLGVLFGKHPMAPRISPKKSWEGFAGSMLFGIVSGILMLVFALHQPWWVGLILGVCLVGVGVMGDLIESLIKRDLGIKDMSSILPGHGGVMDRLDSLLVAAPVAWLIMYLLVPGG